MKNSQSAGGVVLNGGRVAIVSQRGTTWSLPKGHINKGEAPVDAAVREIKEETGIRELVLVRELGSYGRYGMKKDGSDNKKELKTIHMFLFLNSILPLIQFS